MIVRLLTALALMATAATAEIAPRDGWQVIDSPNSYAVMLDRVPAAVERAPIAIVTQASASDGAATQGITIPGNRVFGLYRNDYARRMLEASLAAGIEAPIRLYLTENADGTTQLSWQTPTAVFAPYAEEGGSPLAELAGELDAIFADVAQDAADPAD